MRLSVFLFLSQFDFQTMIQRLKELEEHVSERVYLLDHMQWPKGDLATKIDNFLRKDEPFDEVILVGTVRNLIFRWM